MKRYVSPESLNGLLRAGAVALLAASLLCFGCGERSEVASEDARSSAGPVERLDWFKATRVGDEFEREPWITDVKAADLDQDGLMDLLFSDGFTHELNWLRQDADGRFEEQLITDEIKAPVHIETVDMDEDGDLDLLIASMGFVFPNNGKIGSVVIMENLGDDTFKKRDILTNTSRVVDVQAADLDADGDLDLAVAQFGYDQGEIRWMRRVGLWEFESEILQTLSGPINVCIHDMNDDGTLDITALVSQEWEEIYLFANDGKGNFEERIIFGSTNEDYGSSGISLGDLNQDGRMDVLYTNGDGFDIARPGPRPWHGVQWLENKGGGKFEHHRLGDFPGAYTPVSADVDNDGDLDIFAVSTFADWLDPEAVSMIMYRNNGSGGFAEEIIARSPTHLLALEIVDLDGDGVLEIVTGGFHAYPPFDDMSRVLIWRQ